MAKDFAAPDSRERTIRGLWQWTGRLMRKRGETKTAGPHVLSADALEDEKSRCCHEDIGQDTDREPS